MNRKAVEAAIRRLGRQGYTRDDARDVVHILAELFPDESPDDTRLHYMAYVGLPLEPSKLKGFIYVIRFGDYFRIGRTKNLDARVRYWSRLLPERPELIFSGRMTNCVQAETALHRRFREKRSNNEWFRLTDQDVTHLLQLTDGFYL